MAVIADIAQPLRYAQDRTRDAVDEPAVDLLLTVDHEYREATAAGELPT